MLVDSHCHLSCDELYAALPEVAEEARQAGVGFMLNAGSRFDELDVQLDICRRFEGICTLSGVHPHDASEYTHIRAEDVLQKTKHPEVVGIGECGLDYFYDFSPKDVQIKVLREMIKAAQESGLPLVIHCREAEEDIIPLLTDAFKEKPFPGVIHCYSSTPQLAVAALEIGFYISASGIITFKNSGSLRESFAKIPLDRLLVETDSPYLAPVPLRGRINHPAYVVHTAQSLAVLKNVDFEEISAITTKNFFNLFQKARMFFKEVSDK